MPPIQYFCSYNYSVFLMLHLFSISLGTSIQYFSCHLPTCLTLSCLVQCPHQLGRCHSIAPAPEYIHSYTQLSGSKGGDFYSVSWKHRQSYIKYCPMFTHSIHSYTQLTRSKGGDFVHTSAKILKAMKRVFHVKVFSNVSLSHALAQIHSTQWVWRG